MFSLVLKLKWNNEMNQTSWHWHRMVSNRHILMRCALRSNSRLICIRKSAEAKRKWDVVWIKCHMRWRRRVAFMCLRTMVYQLNNNNESATSMDSLIVFLVSPTMFVVSVVLLKDITYTNYCDELSHLDFFDLPHKRIHEMCICEC